MVDLDRSSSTCQQDPMVAGAHISLQDDDDCAIWARSEAISDSNSRFSYSRGPSGQFRIRNRNLNFGRCSRDEEHLNEGDPGRRSIGPGHCLQAGSTGSATNRVRMCGMQCGVRQKTALKSWLPYTSWLRSVLDQRFNQDDLPRLLV